jgi:hypothetical protein
VAILFGPVPPGGAGAIPGLVFYALAAADFFALLSQIPKLRSRQIEPWKVFLTAVSIVIFAGLGLLRYFAKI